MSCCGGARERLRSEYASQTTARRPTAINGRVVFEYTGPATAVVKGAITGRGYAFAGYGARVSVDQRDAPSLMRAPYLQHVQPPRADRGGG